MKTIKVLAIFGAILLGAATSGSALAERGGHAQQRGSHFGHVRGGHSRFGHARRGHSRFGYARRGHSRFGYARGGRSRFGIGVYLGVPIYTPWYYAAPYPYYPYPYYPPAAVAIPSSPPVYIERGSDQQAAPAPQSQGNWYYCAKSKAYYPYVRECPGGWQAVSPRPN